MSTHNINTSSSSYSSSQQNDSNALNESNTTKQPSNASNHNGSQSKIASSQFTQPQYQNQNQYQPYRKNNYNNTNSSNNNNKQYHGNNNNDYPDNSSAKDTYNYMPRENYNKSYQNHHQQQQQQQQQQNKPFLKSKKIHTTYIPKRELIGHQNDNTTSYKPTYEEEEEKKNGLNNYKFNNAEDINNGNHDNNYTNENNNNKNYNNDRNDRSRNEKNNSQEQVYDLSNQNSNNSDRFLSYQKTLSGSSKKPLYCQGKEQSKIDSDVEVQNKETATQHYEETRQGSSKDECVGDQSHQQQQNQNKNVYSQSKNKVNNNGQPYNPANQKKPFLKKNKYQTVYSIVNNPNTSTNLHPNSINNNENHSNKQNNANNTTNGNINYDPNNVNNTNTINNEEIYSNNANNNVNNINNTNIVTNITNASINIINNNNNNNTNNNKKDEGEDYDSLQEEYDLSDEDDQSSEDEKKGKQKIGQGRIKQYPNMEKQQEGYQKEYNVVSRSIEGRHAEKYTYTSSDQIQNGQAEINDGKKYFKHSSDTQNPSQRQNYHNGINGIKNYNPQHNKLFSNETYFTTAGNVNTIQNNKYSKKNKLAQNTIYYQKKNFNFQEDKEQDQGKQEVEEEEIDDILQDYLSDEEDVEASQQYQKDRNTSLLNKTKKPKQKLVYVLKEKGNLNQQQDQGTTADNDERNQTNTNNIQQKSLNNINNEEYNSINDPQQQEQYQQEQQNYQSHNNYQGQHYSKQFNAPNQYSKVNPHQKYSKPYQQQQLKYSKQHFNTAKQDQTEIYVRVQQDQHYKSQQQSQLPQQQIQTTQQKQTKNNQINEILSGDSQTLNSNDAAALAQNNSKNSLNENNQQNKDSENEDGNKKKEMSLKKSESQVKQEESTISKQTKSKPEGENNSEEQTSQIIQEMNKIHPMRQVYISKEDLQVTGDANEDQNGQTNPKKSKADRLRQKWSNQTQLQKYISQNNTSTNYANGSVSPDNLNHNEQIQPMMHQIKMTQQMRQGSNANMGVGGVQSNLISAQMYHHYQQQQYQNQHSFLGDNDDVGFNYFSHAYPSQYYYQQPRIGEYDYFQQPFIQQEMYPIQQQMNPHTQMQLSSHPAQMIYPSPYTVTPHSQIISPQPQQQQPQLQSTIPQSISPIQTLPQKPSILSNSLLSSPQQLQQLPSSSLQQQQTSLQQQQQQQQSVQQTQQIQQELQYIPQGISHYAYSLASQAYFSSFALKRECKIDEQLWYYIDRSETQQGPFSSIQMDLWNVQNYFPDDLKIKFQNHDNDDEDDVWYQISLFQIENPSPDNEEELLWVAQNINESPSISLNRYHHQQENLEIIKNNTNQQVQSQNM